MRHAAGACFLVLVLELAGVVPPFTPHARASVPSSSAHAAPLAIFRSSVPKLARARVPVYLPSWLPAMKGPLYPFATVSSYPDPAAPNGRVGYFEVELSDNASGPCNACDVFFIRGTTGHISIPPATYPVRLGMQRWGYVSHYLGSLAQQFQWYVGSSAYAMRCGCSDGQYARIARSVVRVH